MKKILQFLKRVINIIASISLIFIIFQLVMFGVYNMENRNHDKKNVPYSEFIKYIDNDNIIDIKVIADRYIDAILYDNSRITTYMPIQDDNLLQRIIHKDIKIDGSARHHRDIFYVFIEQLSNILFYTILYLFIFGVFSTFSARQIGGNLSSNKTRLTKTKIKFNDVAGCDEAKLDVSEVVYFLKNPSSFYKIGAKIPRGVLLVGPPGTGKTLLAKAVSGEANVPFYSISGSDFVEMFVGLGALRVRQMFADAKKNAPCIIFIDELDSVGRRRGSGLGGGHDEREQTLNQLLVEMDGMDTSSSVIIIAATNRADVLDPALLRAGRFDRSIYVQLPDIIGRRAILNIHLKNIKIENNLDVDIIAKSTAGLSGAELANIVNEAALYAARMKLDFVSLKELEYARDKILMGPEKKSLALTNEDKKLTAFHESGHVLLGILLKSFDPLYKVSIIPRGNALGVTVFLPDTDKFSIKRKYLIDKITILYGGRIAEELIFGNTEITTGASNDIKVASDLVRKMVTQWGLSKLGPIVYDEYNNDEVFLGYSLGSKKHLHSNITMEKIDNEVNTIINECYLNAKKLLKKNLKILKNIAEMLLLHETLSANDVIEVINKLKKNFNIKKIK